MFHISIATSGQDTAPAGDAEKDEIVQKEIRLWISQSTEGQILES